jgi:glycosyltransferase involved in cell wall biosynthesis
VVDNRFFSEGARMIREKQASHADLGVPKEYLLYVGRFAPEKNLVRLLQAFERYRTREPAGWGLVMVGAGPLRDRLERVARERNLEVVWTGFKSLQELLPFYAHAGCFILPSISEPWGLVVNEAMASGLPVIVSRRCGCAEDLVRDGENGFLFDPEDPAELAEQMARIAGLSKARRAEMGKVSQEIVSAFTPETWAKNLTLAIKEAVGAAR